MFDYNVMLKMLVIPETRFASVVIMLWEPKEINHSFGDWCRMEFIWKQLEEGIICDTIFHEIWWERENKEPTYF